MRDPRLAYQEAAVRGARPVRLTILLYEQVIQDISRASDAIGRGDFEALAREIGHATGVTGYLQATLNRNASASIVRNLASFYTMLREQLMEAQVRRSREVLANLRQQVLEVREAWLKVEEETSNDVT